MGASTYDWERPEEFPVFSENQVHVWMINISDFYGQPKKFEHFLNRTEKTRAAQFKYDDSRQNFIICRGALRFLLSRYLDENPAKIDIKPNPEGKPVLTEEHHHHDLEFNISHSEEVCLIALSQNLEVGVDVEALKPLTDLEDMANSFLSMRELGDFLSSSPEKKLTMFYDLWSAKEALLKAIGCGLMIHPREMEIQEIREKKNFSVEYRSNVIDIPHIELVALDGLEGYTAWLAVVGKVDAISKFTLPMRLMPV